MNERDIKEKVRRFRREYGIKRPSLASMQSVFERQGFTTILSNQVINDENVTTIIDNLGLVDMIALSDGFLYLDNNYRLVFLNEKLSDDEKLLVLLHEEGHYYCGHTTQHSVIGKNVVEEHEANEFVHYLQQLPLSVTIGEFISENKRIIAVIALATIIIFLVFGAIKVYHDRMLYEGEYYVTANGEKYHLKQCVTIQGHEIRRLTKEDVLSGRYSPCGICLPED